MNPGLWPDSQGMFARYKSKERKSTWQATVCVRREQKIPRNDVALLPCANRVKDSRSERPEVIAYGAEEEQGGAHGWRETLLHANLPGRGSDFENDLHGSHPQMRTSGLKINKRNQGFLEK